MTVPQDSSTSDRRPGSAAWWTSRPPRGSEKRRGRPSRAFDEIVQAALDLVDELGVDAFNMRALAARLDTSTATLYRHVDSKQELMVYVVDRLLDGSDSIDIPREPLSWQESARRRVLQLHRMLSAHPNVVPLLAAEVPIGPNGLAAREAALTELVASGLSTELAARAYTTLAHYTIGFAAQQSIPGAPGPAEARELRHYYGALDHDQYPSTVAAATALTTVPPDVEFLEGLQFILEGIGQAITRQPSTAIGPPGKHSSSDLPEA